MDFKSIKNIILSFVFTKRCSFCNDVCDIRDEICKGCAEDIHTIDGEICFNCGCSKLLCNGKEKKHFYESLCAPFYYKGAAQKAVIALKHKNIDSIIEKLSEEMYQSVKKHYGNLDFDCCTYVPMHKDDIKNRGYNQAQLLCEKIAEKLEVPCYPLLKKDFKTKSQHTLPQIKRSGNLLGAISFNESGHIDIENMRILLCDDIKTTGATLDECTKTLLFENCAEVRCVTACISYKDENKTK